MWTAPQRMEIAGVAGAGKSTLARALVDRYPDCRVADSLHTRLPAHWPYVAHSVQSVLPLIAATARSRPALSWDEIKFAVYVSEWDRYLRREHREGLVVLDQGPIFALARLLWGQKPVTRSEPFRAWVSTMVLRWSFELDVIVWLDAPDHALHERIGSREQRHEAKGRPTREVLELLGTHRQAYRSVLESIARLGAPPVLRFDTSRMSPPEIADAVDGALAAGASRIAEAAGSRS
jgi:shikimate kinase